MCGINRISPPLSAGGQLSVLNFDKGGIEKKLAGGTKRVPARVKEFPKFLLGEAHHISWQKQLLKIKCGFEDLISNMCNALKLSGQKNVWFAWGDQNPV